MVPNKFYRWLKSIIPYVFWGFAFITLILTLMPHNAIPRSFHLWDKVQHALVFFVLMFTGGIAYSRFSLLLAVWLIAYGTGIEVMQEYFTSSRNGDKMDIVADTVGVVLGLVSFWIVYKLSHKKDGSIA